jgi:anti-sigma B factor antagonist
MKPEVHPSDLVAFSITQARLADGGVVLTVRGELDIATAPTLREVVTAILATGVRRLVLDLLAVTFMDSTALAVLVGAKQRLGADGQLTVVIASDSYAALIVEIAGLDGVLDVVETFEG